MDIKNLLNRKLPVIYRWARRRRYFPHAVMLACAFFFLPVGVIGGAKVSQFVTTNRALAATRALAPEHSVLETMTESERAQYAGALSSLITAEPGKIYQLIAHDFLVMFREPDLRRNDGPQSVWQYRTESCVLDVFFERGPGDKGSVTYYEMRPRQVAKFGVADQQEASVDEAQCLKSIYRQRSA